MCELFGYKYTYYSSIIICICAYKFTPPLNFPNFRDVNCNLTLKILAYCINFGLLTERDEKAELARAMRDKGKTLQQIADELGYKNRSSVSRILNE